VRRVQAARGKIALGAQETPAPAGIYAPLLAVAAAVVLLDQVTKELALRGLADGPVEVVDGVLTLRLTFNSGGAFGLLQGLPGLFLVASLAVVTLILVWARRLHDRRWGAALGLVLGGGLGNLADRVVRGTEGRVVDFVDVHVWPVFNLADSAIVVGVGVILLLSARADSGRPRAR
jgi:signal peptidase II